MIKLPPCEDPSRLTPQPQSPKPTQRSDRPEESETLQLVRVLHVCQPPLLMHVHLGEETHSHRDPDESGLLTSSSKLSQLTLQANLSVSVRERRWLKDINSN